MKSAILNTLNKCIEELDLYIGDSEDYRYMEDAITLLLETVKVLKSNN